MNQIVKPQNMDEAVEAAFITGDLEKLTPQQRTKYYLKVCESTGLNPFTSPFEYMRLNGKLRLYPKRDAADQLRKVNGISVEIVRKTIEDELLTIVAKATDKTGRTDEDYGVVPFPAALKGEARANAFLKAVTKAKRRVTLSISGLGLPDETEVDSIPGAVRLSAASQSRDPITGEPVALITHDPETGEVFEDSAPATPHAPVAADSPAPPPTAPEGGAGAVGSTLTVARGADEDTIFQYEQLMEKAAKRGIVALTSLWRNIPKQYHKDLEEMKDRCKELAKIAEREIKEAAR